MKKQTIFGVIIGLMMLHICLFSIIPLSDPSEARYATIAKCMADSGNYIMPHIWIEGELIPFMGKPPFGFWAMALSIELFGANEFAVRFPSFIASLLLLAILFYAIKKTEGVYQAVVATLITATSAAFYVLSGFVLVDIWLCLFSMGAIFWYRLFIDTIPKSVQSNRNSSVAIEKVHQNDDSLNQSVACKKSKIKPTSGPTCGGYKIYSILVFVFLALGFLTKGPVVLIFFGLPVFLWTLLNNRWATLKYHAWFIGLALFVLIITPWFILAERSTPGYLHYFFVIENFKRFVSPDKSGDIYSGISHAVPKGTAILYALIVCLPWILIQGVYFSMKKNNKFAIFAEIKERIGKLNPLVGFKFKKRIFKPTHEINIYFIGLISITLFWCLSSHLMLYYMILITPLFGVWCANTFYKYRLSYKKVANIAIIAFILYSLSYIPAIIFIEKKKTTRTIALKAVEIYNKNNISGKVIFARKTPYSAYFYTGNLILPHKKEMVIDSIARQSETKNDLYILRNRYIKRIPLEEKDSFSILYKDSNWAILSIKKDLLTKKP